MSTPLNPHAVHAMIAQDTAAITELKTLLLNERELLEQRQHEALPGIIERKDHLLEGLAFNARQRQSLLQSQGLKATSENWQLLLEQSETTRELLEPWRLLTAAFLECKGLNDINGKMIGRSKQTLGHLLNLLRGQVAAPQLYTNTGTTTSKSSSYCVAKA